MLNLNDIPIHILWLIVGSFFIALEAFGASGIGFLFAGLAAFVVALLIEFNVVSASAYIAQLGWFFGFTMLWAAILWKPMKRFRIGKGKPESFSNIVGEAAIVSGSGLKKGEIGQVKWSGTLMKAQLAEDEPLDLIGSGVTVIVKDMRGATLIVKKKVLDAEMMSP